MKKWLLPREHGAYMELLFPMLSAWLLVGATRASLWLAGGAVCAFLAHESFLVVIGARGARRQREERGRALRWLAGLGGMAAIASLAALAQAGAEVAVAVGCLAPLAVAVLIVVLRGAERSLLGELLVAVVLSAVTAPVALAAGAAPGLALRLVGVWSAVFCVGTLAARGTLFAKRDGGALRRSAALAGALVALSAAGLGYALGEPLWVVIVPVCVLALALHVRPQPAKRAVLVGLLLTTASALALLLAVVVVVVVER